MSAEAPSVVTGHVIHCPATCFLIVHLAGQRREIAWRAPGEHSLLLRYSRPMLLGGRISPFLTLSCKLGARYLLHCPAKCTVAHLFTGPVTSTASPTRRSCLECQNDVMVWLHGKWMLGVRLRNGGMPEHRMAYLRLWLVETEPVDSFSQIRCSQRKNVVVFYH